MKKLLFTCILILLTGNVNAKVRRYVRPMLTPSVIVKSFLVATNDGTILKEQGINTVRPIASISKLMLALLVSNQNLSESLAIPAARSVQSGIPKYAKYLTRYELLNLALIKSDNFAAQILCLNLPRCVQSMNDKAFELGMINTHYNEPTGLDRGNVSTASDLLKLIIAATSNKTITDISSRPSVEIIIYNKSIIIHNTNPLTNTLNIVLSKTGFTDPAGGCLVMVVNTGQTSRIYILLGSRNSHTRIPDMLALIKES